MNLKYLLVTFLLFACPMFSSPEPRADNVLDRRIAMGPGKADSVGYISEILQSASVAGGIEDTRESCATDSTLTIPDFQGTLSDALTRARGTIRTMSWKVSTRNLVVSLGNRQDALLETKIKEFEFDKRARPEVSTNLLMSQTEVARAIQQEKITLKPPELGFSGGRAEKLLVVLQNVTLRQALNAIANADHPRVWLFQRNTCQGQDSLLIQWLVK